MLNKQEVKELLLQNTNKFYAYELYRPDKDYVFYVGKGCNNRVLTHERDAVLTNINLYRYNIIRKLFKNNLSVYYNIFFSENENDAFVLESELIKKYGRKNIGTGCLSNLTDGGEGVSGFIQYDSAKQKISESLKEYYKDPVNCNKISYYVNKSYKNNPEIKTKISNTLKKYYESPETHKKQSDILKKMYIDRPELKAKISDSLFKNHLENPEQAKKHSEIMINKWKDPLIREYIVSKMKKVYIDRPELCKNNSKRMLEYYKDHAHIEEARQNTLNRFKNPKEREKQSKRMLKRFRSEKERKNHSKAMKKKFDENPEIKIKMSQKMYQRSFSTKEIKNKCKKIIKDNNLPSERNMGNGITVIDKTIYCSSGLKKWLEFEEYLLTLT